MGPEESQHESPLTKEELHAIADRQVFRNRLAFISAVLQVVATSAFVIIAVILLASNGAQKAFSIRSDCKSTYNSILSGPVIQRDNLQADVSALTGNLQSQLGSALLGVEKGKIIPQEVIDSFTSTKDTLDIKRVELQDAIADVKKLPSVAKAEQNGFVFNGTRYPACPSAT